MELQSSETEVSPALATTIGAICNLPPPPSPKKSLDHHPPPPEGQTIKLTIASRTKITKRRRKRSEYAWKLRPKELRGEWASPNPSLAIQGSTGNCSRGWRFARERLGGAHYHECLGRVQATGVTFTAKDMSYFGMQVTFEEHDDGIQLKSRCVVDGWVIEDDECTVRHGLVGTVVWVDMG
ncbi:hypothetical protein K440DRAFT_644155 [Wilcoxina mikolae CBS 423.85]|nr:hypothetical protein K440DRAFT_644155 [Wilcoxina mikolae CBS 423.85]